MAKNNTNNSAIMVLTAEQKELISKTTPKEFIKTRVGKGSRSFDYVEIGYVVSRLNQIYGALFWDFEITDKAREGGSIWVQGKLTIKDHKGHDVSKTQFGQCEIKEKQALGDAYKSASSDCLKKCASMFGIAQDVYWKQLDTINFEEKTAPKKVLVATKVDDTKFRQVVESIKKEVNIEVLRELSSKILDSKVYTDKQKRILVDIIDTKITGSQK